MVKLTAKDVAWIIDRPVTGQENPDESIFVTDGTREMTLILDGEGNRLTFNGQLVDVGEDVCEFLGVMDEIAEQGHSEPYVPEDQIDERLD